MREAGRQSVTEAVVVRLVSLLDIKKGSGSRKRKKLVIVHTTQGWILDWNLKVSESVSGIVMGVADEEVSMFQV